MVLLFWPPPDHLWIGRKSRQFPPLSDRPTPAQASPLRSYIRPELRFPHAAAQTRIVSVARIRLDSRKSVRPFKGIFCDDISEFESHMPSHAVGSLWRVYPVHGLCESQAGSTTAPLGAGFAGADGDRLALRQKAVRRSHRLRHDNWVILGARCGRNSFSSTIPD